MNNSLFLNHFQSLCKKNNVIWGYSPDGFPSYYLEENRVEISRIEEFRDYLDALHELGHLINKHQPSSWDEEVCCEIQAWQWAYENSIIPVSTEYKKEIEETRIHGTWERDFVNE